MPDQSSSLNLTPAERRMCKRLAQIVNNGTPEFSRDDSGTLMARTGQYLYRFNASEGRWNDAGKADDDPDNFLPVNGGEYGGGSI